MKKDVKQRIINEFDNEYKISKSYEDFKKDTNFDQLLEQKRNSHRILFNKKQFYLSGLVTILLIVIACFTTNIITRNIDEPDYINKECSNNALLYIMKKCNKYVVNPSYIYSINGSNKLLIYYGETMENNILVFCQVYTLNIDKSKKYIIKFLNESFLQTITVASNYQIWTLDDELLVNDNTIDVSLDIGNNHYEMTIYIDKNHVKNFLK